MNSEIHITSKNIKLYLPNLVIQNQEEQDFLLQISNLETWVAELPIANIEKTSELVYKMLKKLNGRRIAPQTRSQFTGLLFRPAHQMLCASEKYFLNAVLPFAEADKHIIYTVIGLTVELAIAYKWMVHDLLAQNKLDSVELKLLMSSIFYAVRQLTNLIYLKALVYQPAPTGSWRELHQLFVFAKTNHWASNRFKIARLGLGRADEETETTVRNLYLRILLFSTAATIKLRPREIRALYWTLPQWIDTVKLKSASNTIMSETKFVVKLNQNKPPILQFLFLEHFHAASLHNNHLYSHLLLQE